MNKRLMRATGAAPLCLVLLVAGAGPATAAPAVRAPGDALPEVLQDLSARALSVIPQDILALGTAPELPPLPAEGEALPDVPAGPQTIPDPIDAGIPAPDSPAPAPPPAPPAEPTAPLQGTAITPDPAPLQDTGGGTLPPAASGFGADRGHSKTATASETDEGTAAGTDRRYLVRYKSGTDVAAEARSLRSKGLAVGRTFTKAVDAAVVSATPKQAAALERSGRVVAVEADGPVQISDTQQQAPWGLDRIDQTALPLSSTYSYDTQGTGVNVYVVDTGVRRTHAEFGGRVTAGWSAVADGLGSGDCNGHGTHVAGSVAASTYGVAKAAKIVPVRVLGCDGGGRMSDVVAGLDWIAGHHQPGAPAVANLSLGGGANSTVDAAVQGVIDDGVTAVVAAGNSSVDACTASPARTPAALTVAASDSNDRQASFSNFGSCVDLYGPGVSIRAPWYTGDTAVATLSGTSMAAPHVAGAAALLLSRDPALSAANVAAMINSTAVTGKITGTAGGTPNRLLHVAAAASGMPGTGSIVGTTPEITGHTPGAGATNVPPAANITVTFSTAVQGISATTFALKDSAGTTVPATVAYDATTRTATLDPASSLAAGAAYSVTLTGGPSAIRGTNGVPLASSSWSFTTDAPPKIKGRKPGSGATGIKRGANVAVTFTEPVLGVSTYTVVLKNASTGKRVAASVYRGSTTNQWVLNPDTRLAPGTRYRLSVRGGESAIRDRGANPLTTAGWTFTTSR